MADQQVKIIMTADTTGVITGANQVQNKMKEMESSVGGALTSVGGAFTSMTSKWMGYSAAAYAAFEMISKGYDMIKAGAKYDQQSGILDNLSAKYNTTSNDIVASMRKASEGMVANADLMQVALGGIAKKLTPEQLNRISDAAVMLGHVTGETTTEALTKLSDALETGRLRAAKQLAGTIDLKEAFGDLAGKLTDTEKAQAMYAMIMIKTTDWQNQQKMAVDETADKLEQLEVKWKNLITTYERYGKLLAIGLLDPDSLKAPKNIPSGSTTSLNLGLKDIKSQDLLDAIKAAAQARKDAASSGTAEKDILSALMSEYKKYYDMEIEGIDHVAKMRTLAGENELNFAQEIINKKQLALNKEYDHQSDAINENTDNQKVAQAKQDALYAEYSKRWQKYADLRKEADLNALNKLFGEYASYYETITGYEDAYRQYKLLAIDREEQRNALYYKNSAAAAQEAADKKMKLEQDYIALLGQHFDTEHKFQKDTITNTIAVFENASSLYKKDSSEYNRLQDFKKAAQVTEMLMEAEKNAKIITGLFARSAAETTAAAIEQVSMEDQLVLDATDAVAKQATAGPYVGFVLAAAMAAMMASLLGAAGIAFGGGSSTSESVPKLPASTVLGAAAGTASESISKSYELMKNTYDLEDTKLTAIYDELKNLNLNMTEIVTSIVKTGGITTAGMNLGLGTDYATMTNAYAAVNNQSTLINDKIFSALTNPMRLFSDSLNKYDILGNLNAGFSKWVNKELGSLYSGLYGSSETNLMQQGFALSSYAHGGTLDIQNWAKTQTTDKSWFSKDTSISNTLMPLTDDQEIIKKGFNEIYSTLSDSLITMSKDLGGDVTKATSYIIQSTKINLKDMSTDDMNKTMSAYFSGIADDAAKTLFGGLIKEYQELSEGPYQTVTRLFTDLQTVSNAMDMVGNSFKGTTDAAIAFSEALVKDMGSLKDVQAGFSTYFDKFFTAQQQQDYLSSSLTTGLASLGLGSIPTDRQGFVALMNKELDAGDAQAVGWLMSMSGYFDSFFKYTEDASKSALDTATANADAAKTAYEAAKTAAENALKDAFSAEKTKVTDLYNAQLKTANDNLSAITSTVNQLSSAKDKMKLTDSATDAIAFARSKQALMKGVYNDDILSAVTAIAPQSYSTRESYLRDYYQIKNKIGDLEGQAMRQESAAQQQINILTDTYNAELKAYDDQYNALLHIDTSVMSVADAIAAYNKTIATALGISTTTYTGGVCPSRADGGLVSGPESGYGVTLHGTEVIVSSKKSYPATVQGTGNNTARLESLLVALNSKIDKLNGDNAKYYNAVVSTLDNFDTTGLKART